MTGRQVDPSDYVVIAKRSGIFPIVSFTHATSSSADSVVQSDSPEIRVGLSRLAVDKRPEGFARLDLVDVDVDGGQEGSFKASVLVDMSENKVVDWDRLTQGAKGLKIRGTLIGVKREEGETIWFLAKIKGVEPGL
jgi:hypothetical protein